MILFLPFLGSVPAQTAGALDEAFNPNINDPPYTVVTQPDGKILIVGDFTNVGGTGVGHLARLNADGTRDTTFSCSTDVQVYTAAVQPDGKILIGGNFRSVNGTARTRIARLNPNGTIESTTTFFAATAELSVYCFALQPDGKILLGGRFASINSVTRRGLARLNANGTLDTSFVPPDFGNGSVNVVALQADGNILVGGEFTQLNSATRGHLVRLSSTGAEESTTTFNIGTGANDDIKALIVQPDGKILVGGQFTTFNGATRNRIARLNPNGSVESTATFNPGTAATVFSDVVGSFGLQTDGKIIVGGAFVNFNGVAHNHIVRLAADGTPEPTSSFNVGTGFSIGVGAMALQADGKILTVTTGTVNGTTRNGLARLNNDPAPQSLTATNTTQVLWLRGGAAGEAAQVAFELSTNGGSSWSALGPGVRTTGGWVLNGLNLPSAGGMLRARAWVPGPSGVSQGLIEQTAPFDFPATTTQTPILTKPGAAAHIRNPMSMTFTIPEAALPGSVKLIFDDGVTPRVMTLAASQETADVHSFSFDPAAPMASPEIATGVPLPDGSYTVTLSYQDALANPAATATSAGVKLDTVLPSLVVPANVTAEAVSTSGATVSYPAAQASDAGGLASVVYTQVSGTAFPIGTTTVTVTATDLSGNQTAGNFTVKVQDTTAPAVTPPANVTVEATGPTGRVVTYGNASATDAVGVTSLMYSQASGTLFPIGVNTVTVTAKDAAGNTRNVNFTVTVRDTTAPVVTAPANLVVEATAPGGAIVSYPAATATDAVGVTSLTYTQGSGTLFPLGVTIVTATARDAANNAGNANFTVTVRDTTAPVLAPPANITAEAQSAAGAVVDFQAASVTDAVGVTSLQSLPASGTVFPIGTTTVTMTARDAANNTTNGNFTVTVKDTTSPALTVPADLVVEATSANGANVTYSPSAVDLVDGSPTVGSDPPSGSLFPLGTTTVTVTARDATGNQGSKQFAVTVVDHTAPAVTGAFGPLLLVTSGGTVTLPDYAGQATVVDAVGVTNVSQNPPAGTVEQAGVVRVTVTALDAAGNAGTNAFDVTVVDPAGFTSQPISKFVHEGAAASFTVTATGTEPIAFQWYHGEVLIENADGATLTIEDAKASDAGDYHCVASNAAGPVASETVSLEVRLKPRIVKDPQPARVRPGAKVVFGVEVSGFAPLSYQWLKDGVELPGQTNPMLELSKVTLKAAGNYSVRVTNEVASVTSEAAELKFVDWRNIDGIYQALLVPEAPPAAGEPLYPGRLTVTLSAAGAMSGKLEYQGAAFGLAGKFTPELGFTRTIIRRNQTSLVLKLQIDSENQTLEAAVTESVPGQPKQSSATLPLHAPLAPRAASPRAGRYTMQLPPATSTGGPTLGGYATITVSKTGQAKFVGALPDGSLVNASAVVQDNGALAFYQSFRFKAVTNAGQLAGPLALDPEGLALAVTGNLEWQKANVSGATYFPGPFQQSLTAEGSLYTPPLGQRVLNLSTDQLDLTVDGPLQFTSTIHLSASNRFLVQLPNPKNIKFKLTPATGFVSGSFYDASARRTWKFQGVVSQTQGEIGGFYLTGNDAGNWSLLSP